MANDAKTQQLVETLVSRAALRFGEGKSRFEILAELEKDGATRDVAEIIATKGDLQRIMCMCFGFTSLEHY